MGPQHPKDVVRDASRDLTGIVGELAILKADASQWLTGPEYEKHCGSAWRSRT